VETGVGEPRLVPGRGRNRGALLSGGIPGHKGGGGHPRTEFKDRCAGIVNSPAARGALRAIATDSEHRQCIAAQRFLADRAYGKPVESVELSGPESQPLRVIFEKE
jgi:hypothetical protein